MGRGKSLLQMTRGPILFAGLALISSLLFACGTRQVVYVLASPTPIATPWVVTVVVTPGPPGEPVAPQASEGASAPQPSVATVTPAPPTPTATSAPPDTPTPIPTPAVIPGSEAAFDVGGFQLRIVSVSLGASMFAPAGMAAGDTVMVVEVEVLSGDPQVVAGSQGEFDVWTTDVTGRRNSARATTALSNASGEIRSIQWLFGVSESSGPFSLHFPNGTTVDLSPLLP